MFWGIIKGGANIGELESCKPELDKLEPPAPLPDTVLALGGSGGEKGDETG